MRLQSALDFERSDAVTGTLDHVIASSDEPVIAVLIAPRQITGLIIAVVHNFLGRGIVAVISVKKSDRESLVNAGYYDSAFGTGRTGLIVIVDNIKIIQRTRSSHRARARRIPDEIRAQNRSLRLTEAFHNRLPRRFLPTEHDLRLQRLAGRQRHPDMRQIELRQILLNQIPVNRRRRTECGDLIFCEFVEKRRRVKTIHVIYKIRCSHNPLAVNLAPAALGPAGIGDTDMQVVRCQLLPVMGGHDMAERMLMAVHNHLGHPRRTGCEIEHERIIAGNRRRNLQKITRLLIGNGGNPLIQINPSKRRFKGRLGRLRFGIRTDKQRHARFGALGQRFGDESGNIRFGYADNRLRRRSIDPIDNILFRELNRRRNIDDSQTHKGRRIHPELPASFQEQNNGIALLKSEARKGDGGTRALERNIAEAENPLVSLVVTPYKSAFPGILRRPGIDNVDRKIEIRWNIHLIIAYEVLVRGKRFAG